jgi:hypothetical protein
MRSQRTHYNPRTQGPYRAWRPGTITEFAANALAGIVSRSHRKTRALQDDNCSGGPLRILQRRSYVIACGSTESRQGSTTASANTVLMAGPAISQLLLFAYDLEKVFDFSTNNMQDGLKLLGSALSLALSDSIPNDILLKEFLQHVSRSQQVGLSLGRFPS